MGISSAKWGLGRSETGSALHHSVTAVSVKKELMISPESELFRRDAAAHDAAPQSRGKDERRSGFDCLPDRASG
jgi:hypothetical protein